ncbi:tyrosine-type recombinase/integrase [Pseudomonas putida]|uniref:Integrase n=1 Tax=Pseudomonas putida TaxID=303 RepID=A0A2S3WGC5_PSEPU|nr:tyrosine-type recombinase/integrase [Pseudomonas putida]POF90024.1 integrase [Pseudomonas putida]
MSKSNVVTLPWASIELQPGDVRELPESDRDALIVSAIPVDGHWVILSRYRDNIWQLEGLTSNVPDNMSNLDFSRVPAEFVAVMKSIFYRYLRRGRAGQKRPVASTLRNVFENVLPFLRYLTALKLGHFGTVTPMICAHYIAECREIRQVRRNRGQALSPAALERRFMSVEALYELSQYTLDPIPRHPWPDTSARALAGRGSLTSEAGKTPLMPDEVFCTLFEKAYEQVQGGKSLLDLRDALDRVSVERKGQVTRTVQDHKVRLLTAHGWEGGLETFNQAIKDLRTASYIVLASTSGCRNHELANVKSGAHHRTEDDEGTVFHWLRSTSEKTDTGVHDWMIPEVAVRVLHLMERWVEPYQAMIGAEIAERRKLNSSDPHIAKAQKHQHALFLGVTATKRNQVRTLSGATWNLCLKEFAKRSGLDWDLASHQFRRKFANYAAHSQFGDLRYLREHFAHWSMDMTLGYAMDQDWGQHLDIELYENIQSELEDIKSEVVDTWLGSAPLAGGYGQSIKRWQRDPANLAIFKNHASMVTSIAESTAIRSNGHAWCTADDDRCVGNTMERTRCGDCNNAVIGGAHAGIYQRLYSNLKGLLDCNDIGDGGRQRVMRDLDRCRDVLMQLGYDPEIFVA